MSRRASDDLLDQLDMMIVRELEADARQKYPDLAAKFGTLDTSVWKADNGTDAWFGVKAMNLIGSDRQDQLVLIPAPAAALLGLLGLCAAGVKLRRFT